jgi:ribulose-phosphate 3-epimerase
MIKIAPSLLSANFADMRSGIKLVEETGVDYLHCDVMDGMFVPNISFGFKMIEDVKKMSDIPLDVHLMIASPERYVERFADAGADMMTFHVEATNHVQRVLGVIRSCGIRAGVALNPATPLTVLDHIMDDLDMVLLMSVNPGFGGQKFIPALAGKIRALRERITKLGKEIDIEVDGGISTANIAEIAGYGANVLVAGSAIFDAELPGAVVREMRERTK